MKYRVLIENQKPFFCEAVSFGDACTQATEAYPNSVLVHVERHGVWSEWDDAKNAARVMASRLQANECVR